MAGQILEDVALARVVKRVGFRLFFGPGKGLVRTRMYRSFRAMWEGWTKNLFPLYGGRPLRLLLAAATILALDVAPPFGALWFPALWLWVLARHLWYAHRLRAGGASPFQAGYLVPGGIILLALMANSLLRYSSGLSVVWKGREYAPWST